MIVADDTPRNLDGPQVGVIYAQAFAFGHRREDVVASRDIAQRIERGHLADTRTLRVREPSLKLFRRADELDEKNAATLTLDGLAWGDSFYFQTSG
jgi:hypothetical protein